MSDFQEAGFHGLNVVPKSRCYDGQDRIGHIEDIDVTLADADCLNQHDVKAGSVKHRHGRARRACQATSLPACGHAADVDTRIEGMRMHPDAIAKQGPACAGAADIDSQDADRLALLAVGGDELIDQRALAGSWVACHADDGRAARERLERMQDGKAVGLPIFEQRDRARDGADIGGLDLYGQGV